MQVTMKRNVAGVLAGIGLMMSFLTLSKNAHAEDVLFFPPPSSESFTYRDSDGPGTLVVTHPSANPTQISVQLFQGWRQYNGTGTMVRTHVPTWPGDAAIDHVSFTLQGYWFDGDIYRYGASQTVRGYGYYGWGWWTFDAWTVSR
jgi:hypothetical protein